MLVEPHKPELLQSGVDRVLSDELSKAQTIVVVHSHPHHHHHHHHHHQHCAHLPLTHRVLWCCAALRCCVVWGQQKRKWKAKVSDRKATASVDEKRARINALLERTPQLFSARWEKETEAMELTRREQQHNPELEQIVDSAVADRRALSALTTQRQDPAQQLRSDALAKVEEVEQLLTNGSAQRKHRLQQEIDCTRHVARVSTRQLHRLLSTLLTSVRHRVTAAAEYRVCAVRLGCGGGCCCACGVCGDGRRSSCRSSRSRSRRRPTRPYNVIHRTPRTSTLSHTRPPHPRHLHVMCVVCVWCVTPALRREYVAAAAEADAVLSDAWLDAVETETAERLKANEQRLQQLQAQEREMDVEARHLIALATRPAPLHYCA